MKLKRLFFGFIFLLLILNKAPLNAYAVDYQNTNIVLEYGRIEYDDNTLYPATEGGSIYANSPSDIFYIKIDTSLLNGNLKVAFNRTSTLPAQTFYLGAVRDINIPSGTYNLDTYPNLIAPAANDYACSSSSSVDYVAEYVSTEYAQITGEGEKGVYYLLFDTPTESVTYSSVSAYTNTTTPTATITVADTNLKAGETSLVTFTFSEAVSGFINEDLTISNGTMTDVSSTDGVTWTATFTPTANITDATNLITLNNTGVINSEMTTGTGTTDSSNYAIDTARPTATITVADTSLIAGETSLVTFTFSEAVTGFSNADLLIANGAMTAVSSSDGGTTWTATFTPTANVVDTTNLITLNNTGVMDVAGNAGTGTTASNNYAISTLRPTASIVVTDTSLIIGETSLVTITFAEVVSGFTNADLTIENGTLSTVSSSDGGITWTATLTPTANITDTTNLITLNNTGVTNAAGNAGTGTTDSNNYAIDTARPTATIVVSDTSLKAGETSLVTFTFSEAVTGFSSADLTIAYGSITDVSTSDGGITWTAIFTPTADFAFANDRISLDNTGFMDAAGNAGTGTTDSNNYAINTVIPTAAIAVTDTSLKIGDTSLVTITFSEAVSGFTNADLTIANGTLTAVSSSDGGITWTALLTPTADITDATNLITLNNTGVTNTAGNAGTGTTDSNNYAIDTSRPTATIAVTDSDLKIGDTSLVTITFTETVSGFTNADLTIANGTLTAVSSSDSGRTWTATFTPTAGITDTTNLITLGYSGIADAAGNAGTGTIDSNNYAIDTARPTATIVMAHTGLTVGETSLVTITFSEAVTGFSNADLTIANGSMTAVSTSDGGTTWTATFTPASNILDGTNLITLNNTGVMDAAGNTGTGTTDSNNYTIDTRIPTATIVLSDTSLTVGETLQVTITFSEAVSGFTNADLTIENGTLTAVSTSDSGTTWTATFTPTANITDATNLITLDNTGVTNAAGNAGIGTTSSYNYAIDTARPTATIVVADTGLTGGETSLVTITFSEAVSGFTNADLTIANGTLTAVSTSDGGTTWTATFTPTVSIAVATNLITLNNAGVVDAAGNTGTGTTNSNNYTIDTRVPTATIVISDTSLKVGETSLVTITFSEAVSGFTNADLTIANGTLTAVSTSDGGTTWTATFTPTADLTDTTNRIILDNTGVINAAGNTGTGTTDSNNYAIDTSRPTATIVLSDTSIKAGETSQVTITFSEAVSGFSNADLTIPNGSLSAVSSSDGGITWTAIFTPSENKTAATNLIVLNNSGITDAAGNTGTGSTDSNNYAIDTIRPTASTVTMTSSNAVNTKAKVGDTITLNITASEDIQSPTVTIATHDASIGDANDADSKTWTATYVMQSGDTTGTIPFVLNFSNIAGNAGIQVTTLTSGSAVVFDKTEPTLTAGAVNRTSDTEGTVKFTSNEEGEYYYVVVVDGAATPTINTSGAGIACTSSMTTITNPTGLTIGAKDIYIKVKDLTGNVSNMLKIDIMDYVAPSAPISTPNNKDQATRQVEVNGVNNTATNTVATIDIVRDETNEKKIDTVVLDQTKAEEVLQKVTEQKQDTVQIVVDDIKDDKADEVTVKINEASVQMLSDKEIALEVKTEEASIQVPIETIQKISESEKDLYFRIVPIKDKDQLQEVIQNAVNAKVVLTAAGSSEIVTLGTPMKIETNYQNLDTKVTFSLKGITIPTDEAQRKIFLDNLGVYINHSDGDQELNRGTIIYDENKNPVGIEIGISKFSTFTIVSISNAAPVVTDLKIKGKAVIGSKLSVSYTYSDVDKDAEGKSIIAWYRADNKTGKNKTLISKGTRLTYKVTNKDQNKYLFIEVTPVALTGDVTGTSISKYIKVTAEKQVVKEVPKTVTEKVIEYTSRVKLGLIGSKSYANQVAKMFSQNYKNVKIEMKKEGKYYRIYLDFVDKDSALLACKDMKQKNYIFNYYFIN